MAIKAPTRHAKLLAWVNQIAKHTKAEDVVWCDGSQKEYDGLCKKMVEKGVFIKLNAKKRPGCYLARSHASDVARVEDRTFICAKTAEEAGPTNNWREPEQMKAEMMALYKGCM
ncbi:MAG: phosphoenolpyruvate carboxykinase, partial [Kiritimatiellia bacterium]